jgi:DNA-binding MarR family transcriptional regulator
MIYIEPQMAKPMSKKDYEALAEFRYQLRRFLRFSEDLTQSHGITPLQYQLLLQLKGFPDRSHATVGELAERLQAKHHGMVALVTRCEDLGLVRRRPSAVDLRQVEVHLTAAGERRIEQLAQAHRDELASLTALRAVPALWQQRKAATP